MKEKKEVKKNNDYIHFVLLKQHYPTKDD